MRKINKIITIALIFTIIGVFFWPDYAYPANISYLRVPVGKKSTYGRVLNELSKTGGELSTRKGPALVDSWYRKLGLHDKIMQSENPNRNIRLNPLEVDISEGALRRYIDKLIESGEKFIVVTSPKAVQQMRSWARQQADKTLENKIDKILDNAIYVGPVHYKYVKRYYHAIKQKCGNVKPQRIIGIGMGSDTDWAKIMGHKIDVDVEIMPSAISTNAMFTANVAIRDGEGTDFIVYGYKVGAARKVIVDLNFSRQNERGNKSGVWDALNSYVALEDWKLAVKYGEEKEDKTIFEQFLVLLKRLDEHAAEIAENTNQGIQVLAEVAEEGSKLLTLFHSGRPKAGSEHILSDEVERQVMIRTKGKKILHGEQIGVTTLLMAYLHGLDYEGLRKKAERMGLQLLPEKIGLIRQDLINALVSVEPRKGRFSYFDVYTISEDKAEEAVSAVFGEQASSQLTLLAEPTKVLFVATSPLPAHPGVGRALGMDTLTGVLRTKMQNECTVQQIDVQFEEDVEKVIERISIAAPDIIGISVRYKTLGQMGEILDRIQKAFKGRKTPFIVIGGVMPTFLAENLVEKYPFICVVRGEGELPMLELTKTVRSKESLYRVASLTFFDEETRKIVSNPKWNTGSKEFSKGSFVSDLISELLARRGVVWVSSSRGCFWDCIFCSVREFRDAKNWEPRPIEDVIAEIKALYDLGAREFMFADDEMLLGKLEQWHALAKGIKGIGRDIKFQCSARSDSIYNPKDDDLKRQARAQALLELHNAGLQEIYIGFESGSNSQLERDKKNVTVETHKEAIRICRDLGIRVGGGFIMFDPFVTLDEIEENVRFLEEMELISTERKDFVGDVFDIMRAQEGAPLLAMLKKEGLLDERIEGTLFYNYRFRDPKVERIINECRKIISETEDFMYNLKFIVSAKVMAEEDMPETMLLSGFLVRFRQLDLSLLKALVVTSRASDDLAEEKFDKIIATFRRERERLFEQLQHNLETGNVKDNVAVEVLRARIKELTFRYIEKPSLSIVSGL